MPFNYEKAKEFFYNKLGRDLEGQGRMESAYYHTAEFIYNEGCKDNDAAKDARIAELEKAVDKINSLIYCQGAPTGSDQYFKIRTVCCESLAKLQTPKIGL